MDLNRLRVIAERALPGRTVESFEVLTGGMRNENVLLRLKDELLVLRVYRHNPSVCTKELALLRAATGIVPVPEVVCADDRGAWLIYRYVEGVTFQELKRKGNRDDMAQASFALGNTLAAIAQVSTHGVALQIREADTVRSLVHGDFNNRNAILKCDGGEWKVAAILDWEYAFLGSPLWDAARFICYEGPLRPRREPWFSDGYRAGGGKLPDDWPAFARTLNAVSAAESLSDPDLPACFVDELRELVMKAATPPAQKP